jgi:hypothetical protein
MMQILTKPMPLDSRFVLLSVYHHRRDMQMDRDNCSANIRLQPTDHERRSSLLKWVRAPETNFRDRAFQTKIGILFLQGFVSCLCLTIQAAMLWTMQPSHPLAFPLWFIALLAAGANGMLITLLPIWMPLPIKRSYYLLLGMMLFWVEQATLLLASFMSALPGTAPNMYAWGMRAYFLLTAYMPLWAGVGRDWWTTEALPLRRKGRQAFEALGSLILSLFSWLHVYPLGIGSISLPLEPHWEVVVLTQSYIYAYLSQWDQAHWPEARRSERCHVRVYREMRRRTPWQHHMTIIICSTITHTTCLHEIDHIATDIWRREGYPWPMIWIAHQSQGDESFHCLQFRCVPLLRRLHGHWGETVSWQQIEALLRGKNYISPFHLDASQWVTLWAEDPPPSLS